MNDPYTVLGVDRTADDAAIKSAYRKLAMKHHPDRNPGDASAEDKLKEINIAYEAIKDADARARTQGAGRSSGGPGGFNEFRFHTGADPFSFMDEFFGHGGPFGRQPQRKNQDIVVQYLVTLEQALTGTKVELSIQGERGTRRVNVDVPPGIDHGSRLRVAGAGDNSNANLPPGDLYVAIQVMPHERFSRIAQNLVLEIEVDAFTAMLGDTRDVVLLDGQTVRVNLPAGLQPGQGLRVSGHGMTIIGAPGQRGDLIVKVGVTIPGNLTPEQRAAVEAARASLTPAA